MEERIIENNKNYDEVSLKELLLMIAGWYRYLLSKWLIIVVCGITGGVAGFFYAKSKKPVYTAVTSFVLEEGDKGSGGLGQYSGIASMVGIDVGGGGGGIFQGDNILDLYKSRSMIEKTLLTTTEYDGKKQLLIDRYITFNNLRKSWAKNPKLRNIKFKSFEITNAERLTSKSNRLQDSILGIIANDIDKIYLTVTKPDKKLSLIKATVKSQDEFFAKEFNEQIVKNVNDFYVQTKTKKSLANVNILQQKADSVRAVMNGAIYSAASATDATPNLNPTRQIQRMAPVQRSQFALEANKLMLGELLKNLELSKISLRKEAPLIQVVDRPVYPLEADKLGKLKGLIFGGFLLGFLACMFLIVKRVFNRLMK